MTTKQLLPIAQVLGVSSAGVLSGIALSYNLVSVPSILKTAPDEVIAKQWRALYEIGKAIAPPYAATCAVCFGFLASQSTKLPGLFPDLPYDPTSPFALYTSAALLIPSIVPWTLGVMKPTNERLIKRAEKIDSASLEETQRLIQRWVALNWVRVGLVSTGTLLGAIATVLS